jgi:hypothetical protein
MQKLQGRDPQEMVDAPFQKGPKKDMEAIVAYVVTASKGDKIKVSTNHPKEKEMYDLGKRAFYFKVAQWISHVHLVMAKMGNEFVYRICQTLPLRKVLH